MHKATVTNLVAEAGVTIRKRTKIGPPEVARMVKLYEAGQTTAEIGQQLNLDPSGVRRHLIAAGVTMRPAVRRQRG